jgi:branched-chain amino acid transport system substrate-binding protein
VLKKCAPLLATAILLAGPAQAADSIRIGFLTTLSGPFAVLGQELERGFDLGIELLGGKMGGLPIEVFKADTKGSPDVAVTEASRFMDRDKVQFVTGIVLSNEFNAIGKPLSDKGVFVLSGNAGTAYYSGKECQPNIFSVGFHNDVLNEAAGMYMSEKGVKSMVTIGLNYQAGKDQIGGAVSKFKGKVLAQLWPAIDVIDFSSEIAQIRSLNPESVYLFLPGRPGTTFLRQFVQAGLAKKVRVFGGAFHADELSFPAIGDFAVNANLELTTFGWAPVFDEPDKKYPFDNAQSRRMAEAYEKKYNRRATFWIAHQVDALFLIDSAVRAVKGNVENKDAVRAALRKADFPSVKGKFKFNNNHFPIQDHYTVTVVRDAKGVPVHKILGLASKDHGDSYAKDCPMKW